MNVQKGKHPVGQAPGYHPGQRYSHGPYRSAINQHGPTENQGFHVNAGAFPGQGAGVPGSGPNSQQIRGLQMHTGTSLPPPPQQQPHPQPPPTPTSTPPASDMGKSSQIQPSVNFVQNPQRAQGNPSYYTRMSPPANPRMQARPIMSMGAMNLQFPYSSPVIPLHPSHYVVNTGNTIPQIQNPQFSQQRQHAQAAGQTYYSQGLQHHLTAFPTSVIQPSNHQYFQTGPHNIYVPTPGNPGQYTSSVSMQRTGYTSINQGQMNMQPTNVGPQPNIPMPHTHPVVNQPAAEQAMAQRSKMVKKDRTRAIPIIDPNTGKDVMIDENNDNSAAISSVTPPQSNDSSARETPQPGSSSHENDESSETQLVRAEFAAKVAAAATNDEKQISPSPSISETVNGPETIETEIINQSVPNSESVKISKLSSHVDEYSSSISHQTSDIVKESTGHNTGPPIQSHGQSMHTPVVSALTGEIQPNWQLNHAREPFPALKNTSSPTVLGSSPVKNNVRKQTRMNSESEKNVIQEKSPQLTHSQLQQTQSAAAAVINPVTLPIDHCPAPSAPASSPAAVLSPAPVPVSAASPAPIPAPASATVTVIAQPPPPSPAPSQKKEKNPPSKNLANANKEEMPITSQHPHPPSKERRRNVKETPTPVQQQQQHHQPSPPRTIHVNVQPEPTPYKPSFSESISIKSINQMSTTTAIQPAVVQTTASAANPVTVPEDKSTSILQQQQTNGETPVEPVVDGKASQRQGHKKKQKMKDINRKAVEKEGTDMDAFTENNQDEKEKPAPTTINNPPPLSNKTPLSDKISKDELEEKKIVAAKNEENAKVSALSKTDEDNCPSPIIEKSQLSSQPSITLKYKYKEDQWSPLNPSGKKKYERDFLIGLQTEPQSMKKPENLPNLDVVLHDPTNRRVASQSNYSTNRGGGHDFAPNFLRSGHSLSRGGGPLSNRKSQQGSKGGKGSGKPSVIIMSLSGEVKLRETENAWKPARFNKGKDIAEEDRKTQDLYKKVRAILNKLTPQKFDTLVNQVKGLPIDTGDRLKGVINLVFDKAIDEPGFAKAYAHMCKLVANMEVKDDKSNDKSVVFRKLLLARCQSEFESNKNAELDGEKRLQEIKVCPDPEKKKELQLNYEEEERRIRRKSVGNIRFIGELYKLGMLTSGIMHRCIQHLLSKHEEESLECLCKLLTTIGKELEMVTNSQSKDNNFPSLDHYFDKMGELAQKRENSKISSRVRFMLQDVIELRQNKWVPRRDDNNPKTIDQIQRDADRESLEMSIALSAPRKQDIRSNDSDRKGRNRGGNQDDKDGWTSVSGGKSFRPSHTYQYEPSRIQAFKQQPEVNSMSLGSASQFNQWGRGANSKSADKSDNRSISVNNMYSPLSKERDGDKKHSNINSSRSGKITPSPSLEKERMMAGIKEAMDSDRQSHRVQQSSQPPSRDRTPTPARVATTAPPAPTLAPLTPEEIERKAKLIAEEFLYSNNNNLKEAKQSIEELDRNVDDILYEILIFAINKNSEMQKASIGKLFADLVEMKFLQQSLVLSLYVKLCKQIVDEEWIIDIPLIWTYFSHLIAPLVKTDMVSFVDLHTIAKAISEDKKEFFLPLIQTLCQECGENWVRNKWVSCRLQLTDFVKNPNDPNIQKAVEFLSRKGDSSSSLLMPMDEVQKKLTNFLQNENMDYDSIVGWTNAHVGDRVKEPQFIRALTTAICECPTSSSKAVFEQSFAKHEKFIRRFVDQIEELEIQCLCAIQAYINKLEHPSGWLMAIFTYLWENGIISSDAFIKWRDSESVEEGKGVAVKSLTSFFTALNEADLSDEAS